MEVDCLELSWINNTKKRQRDKIQDGNINGDIMEIYIEIYFHGAMEGIDQNFLQNLFSKNFTYE